MSRVPVTAIITTFNEIDYIEDCIRSVGWADEIYVDRLVLDRRNASS